MRNAEEHKKLLEQIAALERDSVNYFDVEKEFFLIDSDNLSQVQTRFYGYSIQADGIYEEDNLTEAAIAGLDGRGCYVYVEVKDGQITIKQDLNGCWGIYLFRHGDYFALSNSFFRLLDHVKFRYPLTINKDYCHYLMISSVSSHAYSETSVNEVQLVERDVVLHIDVTTKFLQTEYVDYREHSISVDSQKGIEILDRWIKFWSNILLGISQHTNFIQVALSGGFDTRVSFVPLLNSGIDLSRIRIYSANDDLHTHKEDFEIASKIANHYGLLLNQPLDKRQFLEGSLADAFNLCLYSSQTFSNLPKIWSRKNIDKLYRLDGVGGETIRGNWLRFGTLKNFINWQTQGVNSYSVALANDISNSMQNILESAFRIIKTKYKIENPNSLYLAQYLYHETRSRHHFGKDLLCNFLTNNFILSPVFDPEIRMLRFETKECTDYNLIMAMIFTRYKPDLLKFPFQGKRSIAPETIAYAQKLNERFPRRITTDKIANKEFHLQPRDTHAEKILASGRNNPNIPNKLSEACLKAMFESSRTYRLFTACFDAEFYHYAASYYDTHIFARSRPMYTLCGVTKVLEAVAISQLNYTPYQDMKRYLEQDFCLISNEENNDAQVIKKFNSYFTARIQFQLWQKKASEALKIISISDDKAKLSSPGWYKKNGVGYLITSYVGKLKVVAKTLEKGHIRLSLLGLDVRNPEDNTKRIPYWIYYTKLIVNGRVIFDKLTPTWHDKPYLHIIGVKADEEFTIEVEWVPHRSDI